MEAAPHPTARKQPRLYQAKRREIGKRKDLFDSGQPLLNSEELIAD